MPVHFVVLHRPKTSPRW